MTRHDNYREEGFGKGVADRPSLEIPVGSVQAPTGVASVEAGDRVWDPLDDSWKDIVQVVDDDLHLADGTVMNIDEAHHIILPDEQEYDPRESEARAANLSA